MPGKIFSIIPRLVFIACSLLGIYRSYSQPKMIVHAPIKVDGVIDPAEWGGTYKTAHLGFDFGSSYYLLQSDTIFLAFDIVADNMDNNNKDNNIFTKDQDEIEIYFDANGNNIRDSEDYTFMARSLDKSGRLLKMCSDCKLQKQGSGYDGIFATGFGLSPFSKLYNHRTWEIAIPLKMLPRGNQIGFGARIISSYPQFLCSMFMSRDNSTYGSVLTIGKAYITIAEQKNTIINQANGDPSTTVIGRRILDDGGVETSFADGSKRINYSDSKTVIITPDGKQMVLEAMSTPALIPPSAPNADIAKWLDQVNKSLSSLISGWLGNDPTSISNLQSGDSGKSIYEIINRRCEVISSLNPYK